MPAGKCRQPTADPCCSESLSRRLFSSAALRWPPLRPHVWARYPNHPGTAGDDILSGSPGNDVIVGGGGNDIISGGGGSDVICGEAGNDRIRGQDGNDRMSGGAGIDRVTGREGETS